MSGFEQETKLGIKSIKYGAITPTNNVEVFTKTVTNVKQKKKTCVALMQRYIIQCYLK